LLLAGVAVLALLLWRLGPAEAFALIGRVGWSFGLIVLLFLAHHALRALAMQLCVPKPGALRYHDALAVRLAGEAIQSLSFTGPLLAEPTRAWLLKRPGLTLKEGFAATIAEYLMSAFVAAAMSIAALTWLVWRFEPPTGFVMIAGVIVVLFSAFLIAAVMVIAGRRRLAGPVVAGLARIGVFRGRRRPDQAWVTQMEELLCTLLVRRRARVTAIAISEIFAQLLLVLELFWLLRIFDVAAPASSSFLIEGSTKIIVFAFPFVPLQVGVGEGAYALVCNAMGLAPVIGFSIAFLRRIRALLVAAVGLIILAVLTHRRRTAPRLRSRPAAADRRRPA
jgi:hypothetical protein